MAVLTAGLSALVWLAFLFVARRRIRALGAARPTTLPLGGALAVTGCAIALGTFAVAMLT